jgi:hypothetical protein
MRRLEERIGPPSEADPRAAERAAERAARHEMIRSALDTVARMRWEQGVAAEDLVPENEEERQALSIFEAMRVQIEDEGT